MSASTTSRTKSTPKRPVHSAEIQLRRAAVGIGLAAIAAIHLLDLPGKLKETPYLGVAYLVLIIAALVVMERLFVVASRTDFIAAGVLATAALIAFTINRTLGMPGATDDIGNWLEPLGLLSLAVEAFVLWQAAAAVATLSRKATV